MVVAARAVRVTVMVVLVAVVMVMMGVPAALVAVFCCWGVLLAAAIAGCGGLRFWGSLCGSAGAASAVCVVVCCVAAVVRMRIMSASTVLCVFVFMPVLVSAALVAVFCCWGVLLAAATAGSRLLHFGRLLCWCAVRVIAVTVIVVMWLLGAAA